MKEPPAIQTVHHDAVHFVEVVTEGPRAEESRKVLYDSRRRRYKVIVSQVILGEILAVILNRYDGYSEHEHRLIKLLKAIYDSGVDVGSGLATFDPWAMQGMINDLTDLDPSLKKTDLMVLVLALADPNSVRLFTRDGLLLRSDKIVEYEASMRKKGLRNVRLQITDTL